MKWKGSFVSVKAQESDVDSIVEVAMRKNLKITVAFMYGSEFETQLKLKKAEFRHARAFLVSFWALIKRDIFPIRGFFFIIIVTLPKISVLWVWKIYDNDECTLEMISVFDLLSEGSQPFRCPQIVVKIRYANSSHKKIVAIRKKTEKIRKIYSSYLSFFFLLPSSLFSTQLITIRDFLDRLVISSWVCVFVGSSSSQESQS